MNDDTIVKRPGNRAGVPAKPNRKHQNLARRVAKVYLEKDFTPSIFEGYGFDARAFVQAWIRKVQYGHTLPAFLHKHVFEGLEKWATVYVLAGAAPRASASKVMDAPAPPDTTRREELLDKLDEIELRKLEIEAQRADLEAKRIKRELAKN
jgi:hypothetical protein